MVTVDCGAGGKKTGPTTCLAVDPVAGFKLIWLVYITRDCPLLGIPGRAASPSGYPRALPGVTSISVMKLLSVSMAVWVL